MSKAVVTRYTVDSGLRLERPVRIAQVSDLHERRADDILALLRREKPDLIMITGDTLERYDNRPQYELERRPVKRIIVTLIHYANFLLMLLQPQKNKASGDNIRRFLRGAVQIAPVYMSLGNHEQQLFDEDYAFLDELGVTLLDNADTPVRVRDFSFTLGGMSAWNFEEWLPSFLRKSGYKLLLCHRPNEFFDHIEATDVDLTLSGHTHGGQIRVGKRGFFVPGQGLFGRYAHGSFCGGRLIVSAGCSNTAACPRFFNPRELVMVEVK